MLCTDGLVERRGVAIQDSLDWLVSVLSGRQDLTADELCTELLGHLGGAVEDDVALLVLRVGPRAPASGESVDRRVTARLAR